MEPCHGRSRGQGGWLRRHEGLRASTTHPFGYLGEIDEAGTVQIGQRADLVLLEENPLVDIINSRKVAGVMIRGRWLSRDQNEHGLASLEESARAPSKR